MSRSTHPPVAPCGRTRRPVLFLSGVLVLTGLGGCGSSPHPPMAGDGDLAAVETRLSERFGPGLHAQMMELQQRHATLWFAAEAENWALVDYFLHEVEGLVEDIEEFNATYHDIEVAELLVAMTVPAIEAMEAAADAADRTRFTAAYDEFTAACNSCHVATDRAALVIQRPTAPPLSNLRYLPQR